MLDAIIAGVARCRSECADSYSGPSPEVRVVSCLAGGADLIVSKAAMESGLPLQVVLPFSRVEYRKDFRVEDGEDRLFDELLAKATVLELEDCGPTRIPAAAYLEAGLITLQHADVLIAIWDGPDSAEHGLRVTDRVVAEAIEAKVPVVWIDAELGEAVRIYLGAEIAADTQWQARLAGALDSILKPPSLLVGKDTKLRVRYERLVADFANEPATVASTALIGIRTAPWEYFKTILGKDWVSDTKAWVVAQYQRMFGKAEQPAEDTRELVPEVPSLLPARYEWVDHLANHYMGLYRSSFVVNYLFGAMAVSCALLPLVPQAKNSHTYLYLVELLLIGAILLNHGLGKTMRWHERGLDYRILAELLRHARVAQRQGRVMPFSRQPVQYSERSVVHWAWVQWQFRSIVREVAIPQFKITPDLRKVFFTEMRNDWVKGQIEYHAKEKARLSRVENRLHLIVTILFRVTLAAVLFHLLESALGHFHFSNDLASRLHHFLEENEGILTLIAGAAPACAAAFHGIGAQAEVRTLVDRHAGMVDVLKQIDSELEEFGSIAVSADDLARKSRKIAEDMLHEVLDWRIVHQGHEIPLS